MNGNIPEPSSQVRLDRRATMLRRLSELAWTEGPEGVFRVNLSSPQFSLCGYRDELTALAEREGYQVREERVMHRGNWFRAVKDSFLVITPPKEVENAG